jgi:hypothetical protein
MGRTDQEPCPTTGPPRTPSDPSNEGYQPPEVMWEEEFAPVADSYCEKNPWDPSCP